MNAAEFAKGLSAIVDLMTAANAVMVQAQRISLKIAAAEAAGRSLSDEDWDDILARQAEARAALAKSLGEQP